MLVCYCENYDARHDIYLPLPEILMLDLHLRCLLFLHVVLNFVPSPKLHLGFTNSAFGCTVPRECNGGNGGTPLHIGEGNGHPFP